MRFVSKLLTILVFVILFGFALKNMHAAVLHFFLGYELQLPLALILFGFFVLGAVAGVLAMAPAFFRHRRDLAALRKKIASAEREQEARQMALDNPPSPDRIIITQ